MNSNNNEFVKNPKGKIRVYACGGCGSNIGSILEKHRNQDEVGFGTLDIVYIDTSLSNYKEHMNKSNAYLIEGLDGSGKVRAENHEEINNRVKAILQQFKPADLNIIISSAAGGSGSVLSPLITKELLSNGYTAIVLAIGSADTRLDAENSLKTIKSFESIAMKLQIPVVMKYVQNSSATSRLEADLIIYNTVNSLVCLFSREHRELDSKDLANWLSYSKVTTFPIQLASLTIVGNNDSLSELGGIISVATLSKEGTSTALIEMPEYQCVGFLPKDINSVLLEKAPIHFVISDFVIPEATKYLQKILSTLSAAQAARIKRNSILTENDHTEDSGLVL